MFPYHVNPDTGQRGRVGGLTWRKASASQASDCVEVAWRKASASLGNGDCVEAGRGGCGLVHVRDSKLGDASPVLTITPQAWAAFLCDLKRVP